MLCAHWILHISIRRQRQMCIRGRRITQRITQGITKRITRESIFGPLNFFNLRYIKGEVRSNNNIGIKKCTTIFLWVLNFGEVGEILENFQKHPLGESFEKLSQKYFFGKIMKGFPCKK